MPNSQKKKKNAEVLEVWTQLKPKLQKLLCFIKNKELVRDALEAQLSYCSCRLSEHLNPTPAEWTSEEVKRVYENQKQKNEERVRKCKELLERLGEV